LILFGAILKYSKNSTQKAQIKEQKKTNINQKTNDIVHWASNEMRNTKEMVLKPDLEYFFWLGFFFFSVSITFSDVGPVAGHSATKFESEHPNEVIALTKATISPRTIVIRTLNISGSNGKKTENMERSASDRKLSTRRSYERVYQQKQTSYINVYCCCCSHHHDLERY